jgi:hypothetical protein
MKNFEKNEEENIESINSTFYSHRESGFKNPKISRSGSLKKLKFEEVEERQS